MYGYYQNLLFRELKSSGEDPKIQTGMIIEVLGDLEDASNGIGKNTNLEYYRTKYAETGTDITSITNLKKYIKGKSGYTGDDTASYNYNLYFCRNVPFSNAYLGWGILKSTAVPGFVQ